MADLDDFFAKKDKKKKGTKKFSKANTDVIAKNLEDSAKKELKAQEKLEPLATSAALNTEEKTAAAAVEEDEEWDDYRENKKDYTGLKIESLQVASEPEEEEEETQLNEEGELVLVKKVDSGPWNKSGGGGGNNNAENRQEEKAPEPAPAATVAASTAGDTRSSYVPPHLRNAGGATSTTPEPRRPLPRGRMRAAPDINSEVYFPSLSSTTDDTAPKGAWGKKLAKQDEGHFEEVRERQGQTHSSRASAEAPKLTLGNKFDALRDDD